MADEPSIRFQIFHHSADVRPDLLDLRDRIYQPRPVALPKRIPDDRFRELVASYVDSGMIRNQGSEGACTGFAIASVIDFLYWQEAFRHEIARGRRRIQSGEELTSDARRQRAEPLGNGDADLEPQIAQLKSRCPPVSARMLYHVARFYDEWPGEENEGSSLRGVMKAWQRHGVCADEYWESHGWFTAPRPKQAGQPDWADDAATRPLGVYYRINKSSVVDLQAAIYEVGAIGVSLYVHEGWESLLKAEYDRKKALAELTHERMARIKWSARTDQKFMHAVALVGYNQHGFIVQNSWGNEWGSGGFAVLDYDDWLANGADAWVAVLGAPLHRKTSPPRVYIDAGPPRNNYGVAGDGDQGALNADFWRREKESVTRPAKPTRNRRGPNVCKWSIQDTYEHTVILGSNGRAINRLIEKQNADAAVHFVACELPDLRFNAWYGPPSSKTLKTGKRGAKAVTPKIAICALSGLVSDRDEVRRIAALGPCFENNGVYPIFIGWRSGFLEPLLNLAGKHIIAMLAKDAGLMSMLLGQRGESEMETWNRTLEATFETGGGKPMWTQLKQDALLSAQLARLLRRPGEGEAEQTVHEQAALYLLALGLAKLKKRWPNLEIHLVGHSAGAIALAHFLDVANEKIVRKKDETLIKSCTLFAPACSLALANSRFTPHLMKPAEKQGNRKKPSQPLMQPSQFHVHVLSEQLEKADAVGPYHNSFLHLVSNALEEWTKTPLLGLDHASNPGYWHSATHALSNEWRELCQTAGIPEPRLWTESKVRIAPNTFVPASHESFLDNLKLMNETLQTITGTKPLAAPIRNLDWRAASD